MDTYSPKIGLKNPTDYTQIKEIIYKLKQDGDTNEIEDAVCDLSEKLGHEYDVLVSKRDHISPHLHVKYAEKYKQIKLLLKELERCEQNIQKNYQFVDEVIILQLKEISTAKKQQSI